MEQPLPQCWSTNRVPSLLSIFSMYFHRVVARRWHGGATSKAFGLEISRSRVQILLKSRLKSLTKFAWKIKWKMWQQTVFLHNSHTHQVLTIHRLHQSSDEDRTNIKVYTASLIVGSSKGPWPRDLGQGHISIHNIRSTTSMPNHLTVVSRTTEIWPFECREISTVREVWTLMIAFLEGNSKIGLRQAVEQVPYYH